MGTSQWRERVFRVKKPTQEYDFNDIYQIIIDAFGVSSAAAQYRKALETTDTVQQEIDARYELMMRDIRRDIQKNYHGSAVEYLKQHPIDF